MKARLKYAALSFLAAGALSIAQTSFAQVPRSPDHVEGGIVTSIAADHATIKTIANEPFTIVYGPSTSFWKQVGTSFKTAPAKLTDIQVGNTINVMGHLDPDGITKHAKMVTIFTPETSQKVLAAAGGEGETSVSGRVTAIHGMRFTIARYDQISQVIEVNESTSFLKGSPQAIIPILQGVPSTTSPSGAENITLADVKVGDSVLTKGALKFPVTVALKDNLYVASKFAVMAVQQPPNANAPGAAPKQ